ncbi:hypothetical protein A1359_04905 [Methylomonas lenta]|uniref:MlaB-like STAS domain-containing protein n=1 Tax=Methylomonas lenta TaxID=980561 RepID=A0A177NKM0_9GAMM|nr:STAS domain-containing protein [Methylomonas lenta]OAI18431.1 hypothetical protein A1359_04905 [Methylomonas lenta]
MSKKDENSMIGYDPLAWLHETEVEKQTFEQQVNTADAWVELDDEPDIETGENGWVETENSDSDGWVLNTEPSAEIGGENKPATAQTQSIVLNSVQNIQIVSQLHAQLLMALASGNKIDIDASAVTQIDTATLQLLVVLKQTAASQKIEVSIDFPSESFIKSAKLLGLSEVLNVEQHTCGLF